VGDQKTRRSRAQHEPSPGQRHVLTTLGLACGSNMLPGGCEVQAEQPSDPPTYPVRFKPLLERGGPFARQHFTGSVEKHAHDYRTVVP